MAGAAQARPKLLFLAREEVLIEPRKFMFSKLFDWNAWRKTTVEHATLRLRGAAAIPQRPGAATKAL